MKKLLFVFLFLSLQTLIINQQNKKIISKEQWVQSLIELAKGKSKYMNQYPFNLLYYDGEVWYAD